MEEAVDKTKLTEAETLTDEAAEAELERPESLGGESSDADGENSDLVNEFPDDDGSESSAEPTVEEVIADLRTSLATAQDRHLRLLAEFDNYKKRVLKERSESIKYQGEGIFRDMLEVVDNFERAIEHIDDDREHLQEGIRLIYKSFVDFLKKWEVRGESAVGKPFDPHSHSALSRVPASGAEPGTVVNELKPAYYYKEKLLRPAEVVVAADE